MFFCSSVLKYVLLFFCLKLLFCYYVYKVYYVFYLLLCLKITSYSPEPEAVPSNALLIHNEVKKMRMYKQQFKKIMSIQQSQPISSTLLNIPKSSFLAFSLTSFQVTKRLFSMMPVVSSTSVKNSRSSSNKPSTVS